MASAGGWHWRGDVFLANHLRRVGEVVGRAVLPFPYLNLFNRGVTADSSGHVTVACELTTHGATQGGVVGEEAGVVHAPREFLLVSEFGVGE
jgi:hypothetical protein